MLQWWWMSFSGFICGTWPTCFSKQTVKCTMSSFYILNDMVIIHFKFVGIAFFSCRSVIPYAFVDVDRIKSMRGIYIATQLTPGPVGKRHLLTLITYNRGGKWERVRSPTVDNRGVRINCNWVGITVLITYLSVLSTKDRKSSVHLTQ